MLAFGLSAGIGRIPIIMLIEVGVIEGMVLFMAPPIPVLIQQDRESHSDIDSPTITGGNVLSNLVHMPTNASQTIVKESTPSPNVQNIRGECQINPKDPIDSINQLKTLSTPIKVEFYNTTYKIFLQYLDNIC